MLMFLKENGMTLLTLDYADHRSNTTNGEGLLLSPLF